LSTTDNETVDMGIETTFNHLQIYVSDKDVSFSFYKKLLTYLGYCVVAESESRLGMRNGVTDIWLKEVPAENKARGFSRRNIGVNHLAFGVTDKADVNKFYHEFLAPAGIKTLYDSPRSFPKYSKNYYAVYFEDPDKIKLEVVYL